MTDLEKIGQAIQSLQSLYFSLEHRAERSEAFEEIRKHTQNAIDKALKPHRENPMAGGWVNDYSDWPLLKPISLTDKLAKEIEKRGQKVTVDFSEGIPTYKTTYFEPMPKIGKPETWVIGEVPANEIPMMGLRDFAKGNSYSEIAKAFE